MSYLFDVLVEVGHGALDCMEDKSFTSRQFGEILHDSQQWLPPHDRYRKPLRRGHTAGWVLHRLSLMGLVERTPRPGRWQRIKPADTFSSGAEGSKMGVGRTPGALRERSSS